MYLLLVNQEEGTHLHTFTDLEEAKSSFVEATSSPSSKYNIGAALYDLDKSSIFGIGGYGFYGEPIEEWENEDW